MKNCIVIKGHLSLKVERKELAFERIWLKDIYVELDFSLVVWKYFKNKPSSKSLLQLTSVGFAWEERPLWQHSVAEVTLSPSSPCLYAFIARLDDTVGVSFF